MKPKLLVGETSEDLAEVIGILLGDGNIYVSESYGSYLVRISGHSESDEDYLINYVRPLIKKLFGVCMQTYYFKDKKLLHLTISNKNLVYPLEYFGLRRGSKSCNGASIPGWIFENDNYLRACIRRLVDTDGSVIPITGRNYTYVWFSSSIPILGRSFGKAMLKLGYKLAKWNHCGEEEGRAPETYIGSKHLIRKYYKEIGFSNPKHKNRFMMPL